MPRSVDSAHVAIPAMGSRGGISGYSACTASKLVAVG
jgi:hypothetical protein